MTSQEHPLARVLVNRNAEVRVARLVILEWLSPVEERTGRDLANRLRYLGVQVEYFACASKDELLANLQTLAVQVPIYGNPIVHIEAHGELASDEHSPRGFVGPGEGGPHTLLSWDELGTELRKINLATRFNLLVVGAACYGEGLMLGVEGGLAMPFVSVIGYRGQVAAMSLRHALVQFYRLLLVERWDLSKALDAANREHHFSSDAELRETSAARLVLESFADARHLPPSQLRAGLPAQAREALDKLAIEMGWALHFAFVQIPENKERFAIDVDELLLASREKNEWPD